MIKQSSRFTIGDRIFYERKGKERNVTIRNIMGDKLFCIDDSGIAYVVLTKEVKKKG